jgi:NADP-dependent 3-hydroxy acid dehydrogenase YdfG
MRRLEGKVALVTGGSKGIGKAIGKALAEEGARIVLSGRTSGPLLQAVEELNAAGFQARGVQGDVAKEADAARLVNETMQAFGRVDILVNNAGIGIFKPVSELSVEDFDTMFATNMRGVFLVTKAALPHMMKAQSGEIVNIASLAGKNSFKGGAGYSATKWALRGFAGSLMLEVREHNIRVVTICPGQVETSFSPGGKKGTNIPQPEDVASAVIFAVTAPGGTMFSEIDVRPTRP